MAGSMGLGKEDSVRDEHKGPMVEHGRGKQGDNRKGLDIKIMKHFIRAPPAKKADPVAFCE